MYQLTFTISSHFTIVALVDRIFSIHVQNTQFNIYFGEVKEKRISSTSTIKEYF